MANWKTYDPNRYDHNEVDLNPTGYRRIAVRHARARKIHTCAACGKPIERGSHYTIHLYMDESGFNADRLHTITYDCAFPDGA